MVEKSLTILNLANTLKKTFIKRILWVIFIVNITHELAAPKREPMYFILNANFIIIIIVNY